LIQTDAMAYVSCHETPRQRELLRWLLTTAAPERKDCAIDNAGLRPVHLVSRDNHTWLLPLLAQLQIDWTVATTSTFARAAFPRYVKRKASDGEHDVSDKLRHPPGSTVLHMACLSRQLELVQLLMEQPVDLEARDAKGNTPLMSAMRAGSLPIVRCLLANGAHPMPENAAKETVLTLAEVHGAIRKYLNAIDDAMGILRVRHGRCLNTLFMCSGLPQVAESATTGGVAAATAAAAGAAAAPALRVDDLPAAGGSIMSPSLLSTDDVQPEPAWRRLDVPVDVLRIVADFLIGVPIDVHDVVLEASPVAASAVVSESSRLSAIIKQRLQRLSSAGSM
jgi:hypothetical protein